MPIIRFLQKQYINMMQTCNLNSPLHSTHFSKNFDIKFIIFGQTELKLWILQDLDTFCKFLKKKNGIIQSAGLTGLLTQQPRGTALLARTDSVNRKETRPLDLDPTDRNRSSHSRGARSPEEGGARRRRVGTTCSGERRGVRARVSHRGDSRRRDDVDGETVGLDTCSSSVDSSPEFASAAADGCRGRGRRPGGGKAPNDVTKMRMRERDRKSVV